MGSEQKSLAYLWGNIIFEYIVIVQNFPKSLANIVFSNFPISFKNFREFPRHCADQLIQDAIMYRFLVFREQEKMTWKDQIAFTESMGDGNAHMETKSPGRKVIQMIF